MIIRFLKTHVYLLITLLVILVFIISRISYLELPFYWDEAWVYGPAVRTMALNGISFSPDALPVELYRGHPLLFHVLNALWLKVLGNTVFAAHAFNLLVAGTFILVLYLTSSRLFDRKIGMATAIILALQPVFLAQSTLVLPEIMVALFCYLALYFCIQNYYLGYAVFAVAATLTKETGIACVIACLGYHIISRFPRERIFITKFFLDLVKLALPLLPLIVFLFLQKYIHGWFLFPDHLSFVSFDPKDIWQKFAARYITFTFLFQGRNLLFFSALIAVLFAAYKKKHIQKINVYIILMIFIFVYSAIGSLNFFTKRYVLSNIPLFILVSSGIIFSTFKNKYLIPVFLIIYSLSQIKYYKVESNSDHNLGYRSAVLANKSMIDYCLKNNMMNDTMAVFFLQGRIMTEPLAGYIGDNERFTNLNNRPDLSQYAIISNYDTDKSFTAFRSKPQMSLITRFEYNQAWIELYKNTER